MTSKEFSSFKDARFLAWNIAMHCHASVDVKVNGDNYVVFVPGFLRLANIIDFARAARVFGKYRGNFLSVLDYVDKAQFSSGTLACRDAESCLTWDVARILCGKSQDEHPVDSSEIMDIVHYAGYTEWRLPTLDELKTLSVDKLEAMGVDYQTPRGNVKFWASEESLNSGPEKAFFDFVKMRRGDQYFIEQDRNSSTRGDGYTEGAQTILVTSAQFLNCRVT